MLLLGFHPSTSNVSGATLRRILRKQSREAQVPSAAHGYSISVKAHNLEEARKIAMAVCLSA
jgi:hypothetical protein